MSIRENDDKGGYVPPELRGYGSTAHPKTDRTHINAQNVAGFMRAFAKMIDSAARVIAEQNQLPNYGTLRLEDPRVIEGEYEEIEDEKNA